MSPGVLAVLEIVGMVAAGIAVAVVVKLLFFGTAPAKRYASADAELQAHQQAARSQVVSFGPPSR